MRCLPDSARHGLALIVVVGILGVLAVLAAAFVMMAQLERRASRQRVNAARAYLLARSGIEDAMARLALGQDASARENRYAGEDWDASGGGLSAFEAAQEIYRIGVPDTDGCPLRHAMRPSFFERMASGNPVTTAVDGRQRGSSGFLAGDHADRGNHYALQVEDLNGRIHVNGGAVEVPDAGQDGPNGFLVRLLDNLERAATGEPSPTLGVQVVGARPPGGYRSLDDLVPVLGAARLMQFRPFLSVQAWVDPKVVKPQPVDGRPQRWQDIDEAHRTGAPVEELSGVHAAATTWTWTSPMVSGRLLTLTGALSGTGGEGNPWVQQITATNQFEGERTYPVRWERDYVYAWSQLRLAAPAMQPRAPVSVNGSAKEILAAIFDGLKGTYLEVWDGSAGWDGGFGWEDGKAENTYPYPDKATEDIPWIRTRVDYGMTYGIPGRPWYGSSTYKPHNPPQGDGGKPLVQSAPLGRLKESAPITPAQAMAIAEQVRDRITQAGPIRSWRQFNAFVEALPVWEDLDPEDGELDGKTYQVRGSPVTVHAFAAGEVVVGEDVLYDRRIYRQEDWDSDRTMRREIFTPKLPLSTWLLSPFPWEDPELAKADLGAARVPGLTRRQKDALKAMANPNTDLNDLNPDANLWKEIDKTDLLDHTTELALDDGGAVLGIRALGRVLDSSGRLLARRRLGAFLSLGGIHRDTTQADFVWGGAQPPPDRLLPPIPEPPPEPDPDPLPVFPTLVPAVLNIVPPIVLPVPGPYPLAGGQPLMSYPEPRTLLDGQPWANAAYDGQIGLGFVGSEPSAKTTGAVLTDTMRGDLFDTVHAPAVSAADIATADARGPYKLPLSRPGSLDTGNVFPDGVYSEKDRALKLPFGAPGNAYGKLGGDAFYIGCWAKPNWLPEASPRAHAFVDFSQGKDSYGFAVAGKVPLKDIRSEPAGLYFVPARNNAWEDRMELYQHHAGSTRGRTWPRRSLLWGTPHTIFASDCLNRRGIEMLSTKPLGRLQGRRWTHLAMMGQSNSVGGLTPVGMARMVLGRHLSNAGALVWDMGFGQYNLEEHSDGTLNHLRFGETSAGNNMNYVADATFACVRTGKGGVPSSVAYFTGPTSPAATGRYQKENGATYTSAKLPAGIRVLRITWTEIPCDLWFDGDADGWLGGPDDLYKPRNDRFTLTPAGGVPGPNLKRDVRIDLEVWDDRGTDATADDVRLAVFDDPAADNRLPEPLPLPPLPVPLPLPQAATGRLYYKAVFVNEWDAATRANFPLDVTPFLDDVTVFYEEAGGPRITAWESAGAD